MKLVTVAVMLFFSSNIFAQFVYPYLDFDIDSIKSYEFIEGDSINGELYSAITMEYSNNFNRDVSEYIFMDGSRVLYALGTERINNNGDLTYQELVYLENGEFNSETINELSYSQGNLVGITRDYNHISNEFVQMDLETFEDFDQNNNYTTKNFFQLDENGDIDYQYSYKLEHSYTSQYLDSVLTFKLDLSNNSLKLELISMFEYNDEGNVVSEEVHRIDVNGTKRFSARYEYSYNEKDLVDQFVYIVNKSGSTDVWETEIFFIINYVYDQYDRIIQERYYSQDENDVKYLSDVVDYYRSQRLTSTKDLNSISLDVLWSNYDSQQLNIQLEKLEMSKEYSIQIMNAQGQKVFTSRLVNHSSWTEEFSLTSGVYFLEVISSSKERMVEKMVIH